MRIGLAYLLRGLVAACVALALLAALGLVVGVALFALGSLDRLRVWPFVAVWGVAAVFLLALARLGHIAIRGLVDTGRGLR